MYTLMAHLYQRSQAREAFHSFRLKALIGSIGSELFRGKNMLQDFGEQKGKIYPTPKYMGVQEIPLDQIAGSVGRKDDFDNQFRPLKDHLRERWVNVYLRLQVEDLPAIQVYQVGDRYFVEDGTTAFLRRVISGASLSRPKSGFTANMPAVIHAARPLKWNRGLLMFDPGHAVDTQLSTSQV